MPQYTPSPIRRRRGMSGFTLLEVILASLVTAIISAALFGSMSVAFKARDSAARQLADKADTRAAIDTIRRDLLAIPQPTGLTAGPMVGIDSFIGSGADADYLAYSTAGGTRALDEDELGTGLEQVVLFLTEDPDDPALNLLIRSSTRNALGTTTPEPTQQVLARRVVSMSLRYYDGSSWLDEWDSADLDNDLPLAVELALVLRPQPEKGDEDDIRWGENDATVAVLIPVPASHLEVTSDGGLGGFDLGF